MISQKRTLFILLTFAILLTSFVAVSATVVYNTSCPFQPQSGRTIVNFSSDGKLLSDSSLSLAQTSLKIVNLPSGYYNVSLFSWDGYFGRGNVSQPHEQYKILFYNSSGEDFVNSSASYDLADNIAYANWSGQVNTNLSLSSSVTSVRGFHAYYPDSSNPNSLYAGCAAFDYAAPIKKNPPTCSVNTLQNKNSFNKYNLHNDIYINETGRFYTYGNSSAFNGSTISNLQYNRTSPNNFYFHYTDADPLDGLFNSVHENWSSKPNDPDTFVEGFHTICCRAADSSGNVQEPGSCQTFCIDTSNPNTVGVITNNEGNCVPNYLSSDIVFSWDAVDSNGCSPISDYEIQLFYSNGTLVGDYDVGINTTFVVPNPISGEDYYIKVRAKDAAGNFGDWSSSSNDIYFDNTLPEVTITSPTAGSWFKKDFNVTENDTDNLGLYKCEYTIENNGNTTLGWTVLPCNSNISLDISQYCPVDGTCAVDKQVTDNACNIGGAHKKTFNIDRTPPNTTKIVGEPKVAPFTTEWINQLIRGFFVKDDTSITLNCDDGSGIGCDAIYYNITYNGTTTTHFFNTTTGAYDSTTFTLDQGDGLYNITYWSVDKLGNVENPQWEVDKVDTLPPTTTKTIGIPKYLDTQGKLWVNGYTTLSLVCNDTEVGCNMSSYKVDNGAINSGDSSNATAYNFTLGSYGDGEHFVQYWSNDSLGNTEAKKNETDWVDTHFPLVWVHNPTAGEAGDVIFCEQSIVVDAADVMNVIGNGGSLEPGSGLNESTIHADLYNESGLVRENITLTKSDYGTYEGTMDKQLPAGNYTLKIYVTDNVNNTNVVEINETLKDGVYVEPIGGIDGCSVNSQNGGDCDIQFHVCMRGYNGLQFWMNKIGGQLTPGNLSATITNSTGGSAVVGLEHPEDYNETGCIAYGESLGDYTNSSTYWNGTACLYQSDAGVLPLSCSEVNGKTSFGLNFNISQKVAQEISQNTVEYWIGPSYFNCSLQQGA